MIFMRHLVQSADEIFGCGRLDVDVVFDSAIYQFFDAIDVVGMFDTFSFGGVVRMLGCCDPNH